MRAFFMGTPEFAVAPLRALIEAGWEIVGVACQPDRPAGRGQKLQAPPVKTLALQHGLTVYQPESLRRDEAFFEQFEALAPDVCVVVAYGQILPKRYLEVPKLGCLNLHASILPKYRGAAPIQWALINGETETGVTLMQMDVGMDTGAMIATTTTPIAPDDTAATLAARLSEAGAALAVTAIPAYARGELKAVVQDHEAATMAPKLEKETGRLDWTLPAAKLDHLVRGVTPWPGAHTTFAGAPLKVLEARPEAGEGPPGTLLEANEKGWLVATGEGALRLVRVQLPGKPARLASEIHHGLRELLQPGTRFGAPTAEEAS